MAEHIDILLVEDSGDDTAFFLHGLAGEKPPVEVKVAADGAMALELLFGKGKTEMAAPKLRPRLIVLDLKLPKVSGLEVLRQLKANPHAKKIPVVVLSSSKEKRDLAECHEHGVNSYVVKPMDVDEYGEMAAVIARYWLHYNRPE